MFFQCFFRILGKYVSALPVSSPRLFTAVSPLTPSRVVPLVHAVPGLCPHHMVLIAGWLCCHPGFLTSKDPRQALLRLGPSWQDLGSRSRGSATNVKLEVRKGQLRALNPAEQACAPPWRLFLSCLVLDALARFACQAHERGCRGKEDSDQCDFKQQQTRKEECHQL